MSLRTLTLILLAFAAENILFFQLYHGLDEKVAQLQREAVELHTEVSQLRVWKIRVEADQAPQGRPGAPAPPPRPGQAQGDVRSPASPALTRFLAQLVVVDHNPATAISPQQASAIRAAIRGVEEVKTVDESIEQQEAEWRALERLLTPQQAAYLADHKDLVDSKTDELTGAMKEDGTSIRDLLFDFVRKRP